MTIGIEHFLIVGALLFCLGLAVALSKRNAIGVLMGVELMLNAVNLTLRHLLPLRDERPPDHRPGVRRLRHHGRRGGSRGRPRPGCLRLPQPRYGRCRPHQPAEVVSAMWVEFMTVSERLRGRNLARTLRGRGPLRCASSRPSGAARRRPCAMSAHSTCPPGRPTSPAKS